MRNNHTCIIYLMDAALLVGFAGITVTGLVISSWLVLTLANYAAWRTAHIITSSGTLVVVIAKLALHWRWIVTVQKNILAHPAEPMPGPVSAPTTYRATPDRREFIKAFGVVRAASLVALSKSLGGLSSADNQTLTTTAAVI